MMDLAGERWQRRAQPHIHTPEMPHPPRHAAPTGSALPHFAAIVVGSGFSGLCMGVKLKEAGVDNFLILEKDVQLGGTWRDNDYPGAACDVPGHLYSFSFMPESAWSRIYPHRDELLAYTHRVAQRFELVRHIRLATELLCGQFDKAKHVWELQTSTGAMTANVLISAVGPLSRPARPTLPGHELFKGKVFHSSQWDHAFDLRNKRVAVVGTGASAIQFIPRLASQVSQLCIYQRTPPWVVPRGDAPCRSNPHHSRLLGRLARFAEFAKREALLVALAKQPALMRFGQKRATQHIQKQLPQALWPLVTPTYAMGCKRILLSDDYYPALCRPNVELIAEPAARFQANSVVSAMGQERNVDVVIFGTGFDSTSLVGPLELLGPQGQSLQQLARQGLEAYKGVTVSGLPNFFMLGGPNTGVGHTSLLAMIEASATYTAQALKTMRRLRLNSVEVKSASVERYNHWLQSALAKTVWNSGCKSWYLNKHSGKNQTLWPTFSFTYRRITRRFDIDHYHVS